jgi:hypothetical protein
MCAYWRAAWKELKSAQPRRAGREFIEDINNNWWQGRQAYNELLRARKIALVNSAEAAPMLLQLLQHVRYYRRVLRRKVPVWTAHQRLIHVFDRASTLFREYANECGSLKDEASEWARHMATQSWIRREIRNDNFSHPELLPYDSSKWHRRDYRIYVNGQLFSTVPVFPDMPAPVAETEKIFNRVGYPHEYSAENIHTRLQIRMSVIFRLFLSQASAPSAPASELTTITASRLIMLLYCCAGFGVPYQDGSGLRVKGLTRKLTVQGVYQKLGRYGVNEVSFGGTPIPQILTTKFPMSMIDERKDRDCPPPSDFAELSRKQFPSDATALQ